MRANRYRTAVRGSALSLALAVATTAGCGADQSAQESGARPTLGSSEASAEVAGVTTETTLAPEGPIGPPLAARATPEDILAAVVEAHGPTSDASAQMNRFAPFPAMATPEGAEITELRADTRTTVDGAIVVVAEVALRVPAPADELVAFYTGELQSSGWTGGEVAAGVLPRRLVFEQPGGAHPLDDLVVMVEHPMPGSDPSDGGHSQVWIRYREQVAATDATVRQRLEGWAAGLPLPEGGGVTGAGIQTSTEGRASLHFSLTLDYGRTDPEALAGNLRGALPTDAFAIDPKPATGDALDNWVYLTSPFFAEARFSPHAVGRGTLVNVTARVGFIPT